MVTFFDLYMFSFFLLCLEGFPIIYNFSSFLSLSLLLCSLLFLIYLLLDCILLVVWVVGIVACSFRLYLLLHVLARSSAY